MIPSQLPLRARNLGQACAVLPVGNLSIQDVISIGLDNGTEKVGSVMNLATLDKATGSSVVKEILVKSSRSPGETPGVAAYFSN